LKLITNVFCAWKVVWHIIKTQLFKLFQNFLSISYYHIIQSWLSTTNSNTLTTHMALFLPYLNFFKAYKTYGKCWHFSSFSFFPSLCICCYPSTPSFWLIKFIFFYNWFCNYYNFCCFHWLSSSYMCDVVRRQKWWKNQQCCLKIISSFDPLN
jgi:hypothetical protein